MTIYPTAVMPLTTQYFIVSISSLLKPGDFRIYLREVQVTNANIIAITYVIYCIKYVVTATYVCTYVCMS